MKKIAVAIAILVLLSAGTLTIAQTAGSPRPDHPRIAALVEFLQLTPDQIAAWKQIHAETAAALKPLRASAHDLRTQLRDAVSAPSPDPAAVGKLAIELHKAQEQIRAARAESEAKLAAVLTPEQKAKFDAFRAAAKGMRKS